MNEREQITDAVLAALDRESFVALLERLPEQGAELRARRHRLQRDAWRREHRDRVAGYNRAYRNGLPEGERRKRWREAAQKHRAKAKRESLDAKLLALRVELEDATGQKREVIRFQINEVEQKIARLDAVLSEVRA